MLYILIAILFFGFLMAIHELGHFFTAKLCGVRVNEFAIGMGPLLLKKQGKETPILCGCCPSAATVPWRGEDEATGRSRSFAKASAWRRFHYPGGRAAMNLVAGLLILLILYSPAQASNTAVMASPRVALPRSRAISSPGMRS